MTEDQLKQMNKLDAEIESLRIRAQHTPESLAWYSRRLDRLELLMQVQKSTSA